MEQREVDLDFAASAVSSLSSAVSVNSGASTRGSRKSGLRGTFTDDGSDGSSSAKEPLLQESMRLNPTNHLVSNDYQSPRAGGGALSPQYGSVESAGSHSEPELLEHSGMTQFAANVYSSEVIMRSQSKSSGTGHHGIQFLDTDSAAVSGEYVNIKVNLLKLMVTCYDVCLHCSTLLESVPARKVPIVETLKNDPSILNPFSIFAKRLAHSPPPLNVHGSIAKLLCSLPLFHSPGR